jgi:hypothetical protein
LEKFIYNTKIYDFRSIIEELYSFKELNLIHNNIPNNISYDKLFEVGKDSSTIFHDIFYKKLNNGWEELNYLYDEFLRKEILNILNLNTTEVIVQKHPTFRVQLPNNIAVGDYHKDKDYNHPSGEINFVLALTDMFGTNTVWCESEENKKDYHPFPRLSYGEYIKFDGNNLNHGNVINKTGFTRISIDFRILPKKFYNIKHNKKSMTTNTNFILGEYYKILK